MKRSELDGLFANFLNEMDAIVSEQSAEPQLLEVATKALKPLLESDAWLPQQYQTPRADKYQQFALYIDPQARYSVVSFVWGPGQRTGIHNHTVWGLVGVLRGAEACEEHTYGANNVLTKSHAHLLPRGEIDLVSPTIGDIHLVANASATDTAISIHVYGTDIGRVSRSIFEADGAVTPFVSGYTNETPWISP